MKWLKDKSNLDINSLLISWGLMKGECQDGVIRSSKFGLNNNWFCFSINLFNATRFMFCLFYPKNSSIIRQLGDFGWFIGPKIILDLIIICISTNSFVLVLLFMFVKKFFWLEFMNYDFEKERFINLRLSKTNSERFVNRFVMIMSIVKILVNFCLSFYVISSFISLYIFENDYYLNYIISMIIFDVNGWFFLSHWFGLLGIMFQVKFSD